MGKIIIKLDGGLGNQMFQYAYAYNIHRATGHEIFLNTKILLDRTIEKTPRNFDLHVFKNINLKFDDSFDGLILSDCFEKIPEAQTYILDGYFQDCRVLSDDLLKHFNIGDIENKNALEIKRNITKNSVCINIRRGDYAYSPSANSFHGLLGQEYIDVALRNIGEYDKIFVFSDDIQWCSENIKFEAETYFVPHDCAGEKFIDYMRLMSSFDKIVIPNSTFAWWAAVFSCYRNPFAKIVCPDKCLWFAKNQNLAAGLMIPGWTKIKRSDL